MKKTKSFPIVLNISYSIDEKYVDDTVTEFEAAGNEESLKYISRKNQRVLATRNSREEFETVVINAQKLPATFWTDPAGYHTLTNAQLKYAEHNNQYYLSLHNLIEPVYKAKWLKKYSEHIDFQVTSKFIEHDHKIFHIEATDDLYERQQGPTDKKIKVKVITDQYVGKAEYEAYYEFAEISGQIKLVEYADYETTTDLFSIPLLDAIISTNVLGENDDIIVIYVADHNPFTCLWVPKTNSFYNYSDEPR